MSGLENQWFYFHSFFRVMNLRTICVVLASLFFIGDLSAAEWSIDSSLSAQHEYNDNLFLTSQFQESGSRTIVSPDIKFRAKEKNWETMFNAKLTSNDYSNKNLDSNDQYYNIVGSYKGERETYSIKGMYDLNSSLNTGSDDFGISTVRVNRTTTNISPSYSRMLTERFMVSLQYTLTESKNDNLISTGLVPYEAKTGSASVIYNITEIDKLNASVQSTDYMSLDGLSEYQSLMLRAGLSRRFTEIFMVDFQVGTSKRDSINRSTSTIDNFAGTGSTISLTQETDINNTGLVLDAGFELKTERGEATGRLSRDNQANSYGGVNEVDKLSMTYNQRLSDLWGYTLSGQYSETKSILSGTSFADRSMLYIDASVNHSFSRNWNLKASWIYLEREFVSLDQGDVPSSHRLKIGMTYNFSEVSTF